MRTLPATMIQILSPFAPLFSKRVWQHAQVLLAGAILAPGRRTVSSALRVVGLDQQERFHRYHRVLSRATWSPTKASRILLGALVQTFTPEGPLVVGIDETLERRRGRKIAAKGVYRDPVCSTRERFVKTSGLRWICVVLLAEVTWASRVWALPFLSALAYSERYAKEQGKRHKKLTEWAWQLLLLVRRWYPKREIVAVADRAYASLKLLDRCRRLRKPITFITRLRLDAALYEPAPPRRPTQRGRPRLKGERLPNLSVVAEDPFTVWKAITVTNWYGEEERTMETVSNTAVWHSTGLPAVPLRWVLIRDPKESSGPRRSFVPIFVPTRSGSSPGLCGAGRWRLPFKKYVSAWDLKLRGIGPKEQSRGLPLHCWLCSPWSRCSLTSIWPRARKQSDKQLGTARATRPSLMLWPWCARSCGFRRRLFGGHHGKPTC